MKEKILKKMKEKEEDEKKKKERKNSLKFHFRGKSDGKNLIRNKTISNIYNNNNNNEKKIKKNLIKNKSLGSLNKEKIDKKFNLEEKKINVDNNIKKQNDNNLNNINDTNNNHNNNKKKSNNNRVHTPGKGLKKNNEKNTPKKENINKNYYLNQNDLNMNKKEEENNNTQKISENLNNNNNIIISSQKNDNNNINKISQENSTSINNLSTQISSINNNNNISSENNSIINNNTKSNIQKENENSFINNKSNSLENQIKNIENSINELKNLYSIDELTNENFNEFILTRGASKAIELLNDKLYFKLFKNENFPNIEIIIVYKIYFQLVNKEKNIIEENDIEIFWKKVKEYFLNKNNNNIQIGNLLENQFKQLDFSKENFVKIYNLCEGKINKLTPVYYSKICATTGLFIFLIKDALEYLGIINDKKKTQINRMYQNLCFLLEIKKKEFENEKI